jgi:hypothetical protein
MDVQLCAEERLCPIHVLSPGKSRFGRGRGDSLIIGKIVAARGDDCVSSRCFEENSPRFS